MNDTLQSFAYTRGRRDGLGLLPASLCPYAPGSAEAEQWRQGHLSAQDEPCLASQCPLAVGECDCSCYLRDCESPGIPYGPGNQDYEYDRMRDQRDAA